MTASERKTTLMAIVEGHCGSLPVDNLPACAIERANRMSLDERQETVDTIMRLSISSAVNSRMSLPTCTREKRRSHTVCEASNLPIEQESCFDENNAIHFVSEHNRNSLPPDVLFNPRHSSLTVESVRSESGKLACSCDAFEDEPMP